MTDEKRFHRRSSILLGFFALCLLCFVFILYDAQIINGKDYLARSTVQVNKTETVETFRGVIMDRNGKLLVSNQEIYTVTFDPDLVPSEEGVSRSETVARAVLRLLRLCQECGAEWDDGLPVSMDAPFTYTLSDISATQRNRFQNYLLDRKWSDSELTAASTQPLMSASLRQELQLEGSSILTAEKLIELMRSSKTGFGIPEDFSDEEARLTLGVLYELRLRKLGGKLATTVPYVLAEGISVEMISLLNDGGFYGAVVSSRSERQYHTDSAAHILGRVGAINSPEEREALNAPWTAAKEAGEDTSAYRYYRNDDKVGKDGVEKAFETWLAGREGSRLITTNQEGKITSEIYSIQPEPGGAVALTIDIDFQAQVEAILAQAVQDMNEADALAEDGEPAEENTRGAAAAVVSIEDSSILALGTYPSYSQRTYLEDFAELSQDPRYPYTNRAIAGAYAPGSTFKMVTAAAALEEEIITPATRIYTLGSWVYPGDPNSYANCWLYNMTRGIHGRINVTQAITVSCNYFFAQMGYDLGLERLNSYASAFGLGQPTGIELWERTGTLPENKPGEDQAPWAGFGQSNQAFTPLQLANYVATLMRGGVRYDAHLLKDVSAYDGSEVLYTHQPEVLADVGLSEENLAAIKKGMGDLVTTSLAGSFRNCAVTAGAKTGSAQLGNDMTNGVFVCFAPYDDPEIAVAVVIERGGSGSALASTAVQILNAYFAPSEIGVITAPEGVLLP